MNKAKFKILVSCCWFIRLKGFLHFYHFINQKIPSTPWRKIIFFPKLLGIKILLIRPRIFKFQTFFDKKVKNTRQQIINMQMRLFFWLNMSLFISEQKSELKQTCNVYLWMFSESERRKRVMEAKQQISKLISAWKNVCIIHWPSL